MNAKFANGLVAMTKELAKLKEEKQLLCIALENYINDDYVAGGFDHGVGGKTQQRAEEVLKLVGWTEHRLVPCANCGFMLPPDSSYCRDCNCSDNDE